MELSFAWVLALWNIFGFFLMGMDKDRARKGRYRVSEKNLWITALLGAAPGMTAGMLFFRHKTKHMAFRAGFPALSAIQFSALVYYFLQ
ncbi:DUF1294 domain-containing protein [Mesobacillus zeae]|uniref:DUF1294 domain-containing protein n=1 Tax=Mesobacillus zeae TaxID=1917180 RepID=A0A398B6C0_9BACI|nr:DUF1294 domain-containing protein [Mesobacillus zeae]RID83306.1 DUF1294 domain-containing protein [Mesobacillus zeae]